MIIIVFYVLFLKLQNDSYIDWNILIYNLQAYFKVEENSEGFDEEMTDTEEAVARDEEPERETSYQTAAKVLVPMRVGDEDEIEDMGDAEADG